MKPSFTVSDISVEPIVPILSGHVFEELFFCCCMALDFETDRFSRNVSKNPPIYVV
jgi:hypothetical protein